MSPAAGRRNRRITLQSPVVTQGELGGQITTWVDTDTLWANVRDLSGRETFAAEAAGSRVSKVVTILYRTGVAGNMRVLLPDGTVGEINHIRELGNREGLEIYLEVQS
jgi:SPP1 family predicted phage head-tail adaptor